MNGLKFSGNSQQRKRRYFLHHGTLLCGCDISLMPKYLHPPERQPDYRQNRPHAEFVAAFKTWIDAGAPAAQSQELQRILR